MTKRYKGHEALGITFHEWGALFAFKAIAEAGIVLKPVCTLPAKTATSLDALFRTFPGVHFFNMAHAHSAEECGSVACIGGTVGMICQIPRPKSYVFSFEREKQNHPLSALYYPRWNNGTLAYLKRRGDFGAINGWDRITLKMAGKATDNFLRTGKPNWDSIIPKSLRA